MKILFERNEGAFLPEIDAYIEYLNQDTAFQAYDSAKLGENYSIDEFDTIWEFKGFNGIQSDSHLLVHEYASLSTGKFPLVKNFIKSKFTPKPDLRIFLNEDIHKSFNFNDTIDYTYRDMGIDNQFLNVTSTKKEYDYLYVGPISKLREIDKMLHTFSKKNYGKLCLVGNVEDDIYAKYKDNPDMIFTGKVPYSEVPKIASKAVYGINYIPNKYPYYLQTSTKLLEYLALDLKVITTNYKWVNDFQQKHHSKFFTLDSMIDFDLSGIDQFEFVNNFNAEEYTWDKVLDKAQIKEKLEETWKKRK